MFLANLRISSQRHGKDNHFSTTNALFRNIISSKNKNKTYGKIANGYKFLKIIGKSHICGKKNQK